MPPGALGVIERNVICRELAMLPVFAGGTWDYSQLGTQLDDGFDLIVCGDHDASEPGPYAYVGGRCATCQRRFP